MVRINYKPRILGGTFGVSCIFPTLQSIIEYEEGIRVPDQGYPRFVTHPFVVEIQNRYKTKGSEVFAVQSYSSGCHVYENLFPKDLQRHSSVEERVDDKGNYFGILSVETDYAIAAKKLITSSGIILSARKAYRILNSIPPPIDSPVLKDILVYLETGSAFKLTYLYSSGMAAIYSVLTSYLKENRKAVVIGNTYTDTIELFKQLPCVKDCLPTFFLKSYCGEPFSEDTSLVFVEIPSNPLLKIEDLATIVENAHKVGALVIVDSTIATPWHFNPFDYGADIVIHSTTKALSGKNNHLGGVLFINKHAHHLSKSLVHTPFEMDTEEAIILQEDLSDFPYRIERMAENAAKVASYLKSHNEVVKVYYPANLKNGNGHVISFLLKDESPYRASLFYDNCSLHGKGPSMGFEKTMLMPYALMTQYKLSDKELSENGLTRYLMRLSVGTENIEEILSHLDKGFKKLEDEKVKYYKVPREES